MPLVALRFNVQGEQQLGRAFELYEHELEDLSEPLGEIGELVRQSVGQQFLTEGKHGLGVGWQPLDRDYAAWKAAHFPGRPILVLSGETRAALLDRRAVKVGPHRLVYAPDAPTTEDGDQIAAIHQGGKGVVPQRKVVALSSLDRRQMDRAMVEWLNGLRRGIFGRGRAA